MMAPVIIKESVGGKVQVAIKRELGGLLLLAAGPRRFRTEKQADGWAAATALRKWGVERGRLVTVKEVI